nr:PadR family transcriptional regulator [uncultured Sphingomonas sp.]
MKSHYNCGHEGRGRRREFAAFGGKRFAAGFGADGPFGPDGPFGRSGPFGPNGPYGPGGPFGGGGRGRRRRMFDSGELRLVLLKLLADQPRHGYELIKAIEEMTGGDYAPSPGIVYPTLTMLDDMGLIAERKGEDSKKIYEATDDGVAHLAENQVEVDALIGRLEEAGSRQRRNQRPEIGRAMGNLAAALKNRVARGGWTDDLLNQVVDIIDEAAKRIERLD